MRTDASKFGFGAYVFQKIPVNITKNGITTTREEEHVIEYWSKSVPKTMQNYDTRRLKFLAVILSLEHFRPIIDDI